MNIEQILSHSNDSVILCKSSEFEAVKTQLKAYFDQHIIDHIFTLDKAFSKNGIIAPQLEEHFNEVNFGYGYDIAVAKINIYYNCDTIIKELKKRLRTGGKVVGILLDTPNFDAIFLNVVKYHA